MMGFVLSWYMQLFTAFGAPLIHITVSVIGVIQAGGSCYSRRCPYTTLPSHTYHASATGTFTHTTAVEGMSACPEPTVEIFGVNVNS